MTLPLAGAHAVISGGGTGIGAAIARRLWDGGAHVTLLGRREEPLRVTASSLPPAATREAGYLTVDVSDESGVREAFERARSARGPITILINNAGLAQSAPAALATLAHWNAILAGNLTGLFLCTREFLSSLPKDARGRVVNIASTAGLKGYPYVSAYCAAKHAVIGYTRAVAVELARRPVTVNAVCPGYTETSLLEDAILKIVEVTGRSTDEIRRELARLNPQNRFVDAAEVAAAAYWLCLPESAAMTGVAVPVAGGEV